MQTLYLLQLQFQHGLLGGLPQVCRFEPVYGEVHEGPANVSAGQLADFSVFPELRRLSIRVWEAYWRDHGCFRFPLVFPAQAQGEFWLVNRLVTFAGSSNGARILERERCRDLIPLPDLQILQNLMLAITIWASRSP